MVAYNTGSEPLKFGDLGSKVKVAVTENVCNKMAKPDRYISNSKHDRNCQLEPNLSLLEPFV